MEHTIPTLVRRLAGIAAATLVATATPSAASAATGPQVAAYAAGVERAWAAQTNPVTGAVTDKLPPGPHAPRDYNYGTFQMADAQLRSAERTGDTSPAATAVAVINGIIARNGGAPG